MLSVSDFSQSALITLERLSAHSITFFTERNYSIWYERSNMIFARVNTVRENCVAIANKIDNFSRNLSYLSFSSLSHQLLSCFRDGTSIHHEVTCRITWSYWGIAQGRRMDGLKEGGDAGREDSNGRGSWNGCEEGEGAGGSRTVGGWRVTHNGRAALIRPDHSHRTNVFYCPEA